MRLIVGISVVAGLAAVSVPGNASDGLSPVIEPKPSARNPGGGFEVQGQGCTLVTFEGLGNWEPIEPIAGPVTVTFGPAWFSLIDADAGGSGNFANEPTPETVAFTWGPEDSLHVTLSPAVRVAELFYVAANESVPFTVTGYDDGDQVVATAIGNTVGENRDGAQCTGDPSGNFCLWDQITLYSTTDYMVRIEFSGTKANQIGFDSLKFCTEPEVIAVEPRSWGSVKSLYR